MTPVLVLFRLVLGPPALAQNQPPPNAPEFGGSSPIGLVVIVLLFIAMGFLIRSMNKHLRKVPASFDKPDTVEQSSSGGGTDEPATNTETGTDVEHRDPLS